MSDHEIWTIEELLWTGGTDAYRRRMSPLCLMVFPGVGILKGEEILDALAHAPRWSEVRMEGRTLIEADGLISLAYTAHAQRDGDAPYHAFCGSTWRDTPEGWRVFQHQQTPAT